MGCQCDAAGEKAKAVVGVEREVSTERGVKAVVCLEPRAQVWSLTFQKNELRNMFSAGLR